MAEGEKDVCTEGKSCKTACIKKSWVCRMDFMQMVSAEIPKLTGLISTLVGKVTGTSPPKEKEPPKESVEGVNRAANTFLAKYEKSLKGLSESYNRIDGEVERLSVLLSNRNMDLMERGVLITRFNKAEEESAKAWEKLKALMGRIREDLLRSNRNDPSAVKAVRSINFVGKEKKGDTEGQLREFFNLFGGKGFSNVKGITPNTVYPLTDVFMKPKERAWANPEMGHMKLSGSKGTTFHEMGHFIERQRPWLNKFAQDWRDSKASREARGVETIGEIPSPRGNIPTYALRDIVKNGGYGEDEIGVSGPFLNPYMGKIYENGATEVISMAMEHFSDSTGMAQLHSTHPELFKLMVGIAAQK